MAISKRCHQQIMSRLIAVHPARGFNHRRERDALLAAYSPAAELLRRIERDIGVRDCRSGVAAGHGGFGNHTMLRRSAGQRPMRTNFAADTDLACVRSRKPAL